MDFPVFLCYNQYCSASSLGQSSRGGLVMRKFLLAATFVVCCAQANADILYVKDGHYCSIQQAINAAQNDDVIVVDPNTYYENINFLGKAITVRSTDPNDPNVVAATIIDGNRPDDPNIGSVVTFNSNEDNNSVLTGFTITGGTGSWLKVYWHFKGDLWNRCGGGVLCYNGSSPTISKNIFHNNIAGQGGGIYFYDHSDPIITDNVFTNNAAVVEHGFEDPDPNDPNIYDHGDGGAIVGFQYCDAVITGNLVENNHADYYGGGLHLRQWSKGHIENNRIIGNDSALGAGVHITYMSEPNVVDNLIQANIAGGLGGGGIYVYYHSDPLIERNIITENESANGAGIGVFYDSNSVIRNNFIVNNINGAGIRVKGGSIPVITHNTIAGNTASSYGGGVDCFTDSAPIIEHNIITSNGNSYGIYASTTLPVIKYNNVWGNGAGNYNSVIGDQTGINGNVSVVPNFINPDSNNYHLNYNSRCINAGDPNFVADGLTDFDDQPRAMGQYVDIGADEALPVWNVTAGGQYDNIQSAIDDANDYETIVVTIGTYTGTGNRDIDFGGKVITLRSIDPNNFDIVAETIIDCQGSTSDAHRGFNFHSGEDANSIINGLTITNGGGGIRGSIYCYNSGPTIKNCIITNNIMKDHGSGIYCGYDSNAIITNCLITSNTFDPVGYGGGIYCYRSSPIITNCIITNNSAVGHGRHGGGICCWGADQNSGSNPIVANCIVSGNSAGHRGGGLYAYWSSPTFVNCTVIGNKALEGGGIGSFRESNPFVVNCIVRDNIAPDGNQLALINTLRVWPWEEITEMTVSHSDIEGGQADVCVDPNMLLHWGQGNIDLDPNFVDPGCWDANDPCDPNDDFFVTGNYHLLPGSECIDIGDNNSVPAVSSADIDGEQRIFNDTVDIGADEVVTNPIDLNNDGIVDELELVVLTEEWLQSGGELQTDFHNDGFTDFADFAVLAEQWLWTSGWYE